MTLQVIFEEKAINRAAGFLADDPDAVAVNSGRPSAAAHLRGGLERFALRCPLPPPRS